MHQSKSVVFKQNIKTLQGRAASRPPERNSVQLYQLWTWTVFWQSWCLFLSGQALPASVEHAADLTLIHTAASALHCRLLWIWIFTLIHLCIACKKGKKFCGDVNFPYDRKQIPFKPKTETSHPLREVSCCFGCRQHS